MSSEAFQLQPYLTRIGYGGPTRPGLDELCRIHDGQLRNIPFENFDIALGRVIDLDMGRLFHKLVMHRRGGYCFELNGLLLAALEAFGFELRQDQHMLAARYTCG